MVNKKRHLNRLKRFPSFNSSNYKIYGLFDPIDNSLFYIGCTKSPMHVRVSSHINDLSYWGHGRAKGKHVSEMIQGDRFPIVVVFYSLKDKNEARMIEKYLINFTFNYVSDEKISLLNSVHVKKIHYEN